MKFRPCIDIHNGKVKQIVGGSLRDAGSEAQENFVAEKEASFYARMYQRDGLAGGHVIVLNPAGSEYYEASRNQAFGALEAYPGGLQFGGGVNDRNAKEYVERGASHVIVTSYVFRDGRIQEENLKRLMDAVGRERLVLDLSCRKKNEENGAAYYVVTDRWQKWTDVQVTPELLTGLSADCDEFLIHAVDVEGKASGVERELIRMLGDWEGIPVTYAGGVGSMEDLETIKEIGRGRVDVTIGSALDLFGGCIPYQNVVYLD